MPAGNHGASSDAESSSLGSLSNELAATASDLKISAVEHAQSILDGAKQQAATFADQRKDDAAEAVIKAARVIRESTDSLPGGPMTEVFADKAAEQLEQLAAGLRERSFADLYSEAESFARRSPLLVGVLAATAGFLLARFIKSSSENMQGAAQASAVSRAATVRRDAEADA